MSFDEFIASAWNDHGDRPAEVADRLQSSLHRIETPVQIPPFARIVTHVFGEHLGEWQRGIDLLESLRALPAYDGGAGVSGAVTQGAASLRCASGDPSSLAGLGLEDRVIALATAASALSGRREFRPALAAYAEARELARTALPSGSPAHRSLAIGGNNLACALEEKRDRDAFEREGMVAAAEGGLEHWRLAGTWLEEERAEYRLARSLLQAGRSEDAIRHAERCVEICEANGAPAFERFFGFAALALARHAAGDPAGSDASRVRALGQWELVPAEERPWCESDLAELRGITG